MHKANLLLVDGDARARRVLEVSLRKAGFLVTTAHNGTEALDRVREVPPDLLITDTQLAGLDGFGLCEQIKSDPTLAHIPIIFLTSNRAIEAKVRGLELGVEEYLTRPIFIKEIIVRIKMLLQRRQRDQLAGREAGTTFSGDLADMAVVDLIQTLELGGKSGIIHFRNEEGQRGAIYFRNGKLIDAELGHLQAEAAVYRLLIWSQGRFDVEFRTVRRKDAILDTNQAVLMEGMRRVDEWGRLQEQLPPLSSVLEVDYGQLAERLGEIPDEVNAIIKLFDGRRTLLQIVDDSGFGDLEALEVIAKLFFEGLVGEASGEAGERIETGEWSMAVPTPVDAQRGDAFARALQVQVAHGDPSGGVGRRTTIEGPGKRATAEFALFDADDRTPRETGDWSQQAAAAAAVETPRQGHPFFDDGRQRPPGAARAPARSTTTYGRQVAEDAVREMPGLDEAFEEGSGGLRRGGTDPQSFLARDEAQSSVARDEAQSSVARDEAQSSVARDEAHSSVARDESGSRTEEVPLTERGREPPRAGRPPAEPGQAPAPPVEQPASSSVASLAEAEAPGVMAPAPGADAGERGAVAEGWSGASSEQASEQAPADQGVAREAGSPAAAADAPAETAASQPTGSAPASTAVAAPPAAAPPAAAAEEPASPETAPGAEREEEAITIEAEESAVSAAGEISNGRAGTSTTQAHDAEADRAPVGDQRSATVDDERELEQWLAADESGAAGGEVIPFPAKGGRESGAPVEPEGVVDAAAGAAASRSATEDPNAASIDAHDEAFFAADYEYDDAQFTEERRGDRGKWLFLIVILVAAAAGLGAYAYFRQSPYHGDGPAHLRIRTSPKGALGKTRGAGADHALAARGAVDAVAASATSRPSAARGDTGEARVGGLTPAAGPDAGVATTREAVADAGAAVQVGQSAAPAASGDYQRLVGEAAALIAKGDAKQAFKLYRQALAENPAGWEALDALALQALDAGRSKQALQLARRAVALQPDAPYAALVLGMAAVERPKAREEAKKHFERFLRTCPNCRHADEIRSFLKTL